EPDRSWYVEEAASDCEGPFFSVEVEEVEGPGCICYLLTNCADPEDTFYTDTYQPHVFVELAEYPGEVYWVQPRPVADCEANDLVNVTVVGPGTCFVDCGCVEPNVLPAKIRVDLGGGGWTATPIPWGHPTSSPGASADADCGACSSVQGEY